MHGNWKKLKVLFRSYTSSFRSITDVNYAPDDDEEEDEGGENEMQWAALQRLPTFERINTALFDEKEEDATGKRVVNITKLGPQERHMFIDKLIKHIENDNLRLLHRIRKRIDKVGVQLPTVEVRYKNLSVEAECEVVHGKPLPTLWNATKSMLHGITNLLGSKQEAKLRILKDISGIIKPGRMTLLLGPPGCGKTTLLLALSGKLSHSLQVSGEVSYNGYRLEEFVPQKTSAYISQHDLHIPELTVREAIDFSARCQGTGHRAEIMMEVSKREKEAGIVPDLDVDAYMKAISVEGLESTLQTDYILKVFQQDSWDLISVLTHWLGDAMRRGISGGQKKRLTTGELIVGPTRALFMDEISNGLDSSTTFQIVSFLKHLVHITDATALISLLQPAPETFDLFDDIILMAEGRIVYHGPRTYICKFFEDCGFRCPERKGVADFLQELDEELAKPFIKSQRHKNALSFEKFSLTKWELFKACTNREFLLMKRNSFTYIFKSTQLVIIASITMTVFLRTQMAVGVIDRDLCFYPAWAYAIPTSILKAPLSFLEAFVWTALTYYVIGYSPEVGRFFRQFLLLFLVHLTSISMFRSIASICRTMVATMTAGTVCILLLLLFGGFVIPRTSMPSWLEWGFWVCPLTYGEIGMTVNEFLAPRWEKIMSGNTTLGQQTLESRGLNFDSYFYWISIAPGKSRAIISYEKYSELQEKEDDSSGLDKYRKSSNAPLKTVAGPKKGRMVLPFEPLTLTFQDVQYYVDAPQEMKKRGFEEKKLQLLSDITGAFRPGILTALMGVSGAGKTTLMDVLSGRKTGGTIQGEIRIGGYPKIQDTFARISGYCEQNDIHSPQVTVEESVIYSAWLRLSPQIDSKTKAAFVNEVLETIELDEIKDSLVGLPGVSGLSTEQRKRLTIAVELVANPSIIFLDEPTSGLDARAAAIVMRAVKNVVETGRTVVCTIHQPSIDIFEAFDDLILMKSGGRIIYCGPLGLHSSKVIQYFENIRGVPKIKDNYNPATWMLEVTSKSVEAELQVDFAQIYNESTLYQDNLQDLLNILGSMYSTVIFFGINNCSSVVPFVATERTVLYRETFAGMYSSWAYSFAQVLVEVPYLFSQAVIFVIITYPMMGYSLSAYKIFWLFYSMFCSLICFNYLGMLLVSLTPNIQLASILTSSAYTMLNLFSGFIVPRPQIPNWWIWLYYLSPTSWALNGMLTSQYGDIHKEISSFGETKTVAAFLKDYFGYDHNLLGLVAAVLIIFPILLASLFAYFIGKLNYQRR
ncbi:hypothetical protein Patl1_24753 [Pistacia atlantica]|uniref:Uncharacterized protein n=1 Tax=Pistacia atlantica TaxID=434234 RepID=A0ACC1B1W4_9ROSI|nr:hypothetical protein Patl1_24753 [Pistacia atlantica]